MPLQQLSHFLCQELKAGYVGVVDAELLGPIHQHYGTSIGAVAQLATSFGADGGQEIRQRRRENPSIQIEEWADTLGRIEKQKFPHFLVSKVELECGWGTSK